MSEKNGPTEPTAAQVAACLRHAKAAFIQWVGTGDVATFADLLIENTIAAYDIAGDMPWSRVEPKPLQKRDLRKAILAKRESRAEDLDRLDPFGGGEGRSVDDRLFQKLTWGEYCPAIGKYVKLRMLPEHLSPKAMAPRVYRLLVTLDSTLENEAKQYAPAVPSPAKIFGRRDEIAAASAALKAGQSISIVGGPGVGKTELARAIVRATGGHFADAIEVRLWGDRGSTTERDALHEIVQRLSLRRRQVFATSSRATPETLRRAYLEALAERPTLVLVDDVRDVWDLEALRPPQSSAVIFTSHEVLPFRDAMVIFLSALDDGDGRSLLLELAPRAAVPLPAETLKRLRQRSIEPVVLKGDADCADAIVTLCGGLPLAIEAAASTLFARPDIRPDEYVESLVGASDRLRALGNASYRVAAAFDAAYQLLDAESQRLFRALAIFPYDFRAMFGRAICGDMTGEAFEELLRRNLVCVFEVEHRYYIHTALRAFAASLLTEDERKSLERRFVLMFARYVYEVHWRQNRSAVDSDVEQLADMPLAEDRLNFVKAIQWCQEHEGDSEADRAHAFLSFVLQRCFPHWAYDDADEERARWLNRALGAARRVRADDDVLYLGVLAVVGFMFSELGRHPDALALAQEGIEHAGSEAPFLRDLAYLGLRSAFRTADLSAADRFSRLAREHLPIDPTARIIVFMLAAAIALERDDLPLARRRCRDAIRQAYADGAMLLLPYALNLLGDVEFERGDFAAARRAYERAYAIRRSGVNWFADLFFKTWNQEPAASDDLAFAFRLINGLTALYDGVEVSEALENDEGPHMPELHSLVRLARLDARELGKSEAEKSLRCALHLLGTAGGHVGIMIELARGFFEVGKWQDALGCLTWPIKYGQPRVRARATLLRGQILESGGFYAAARDAYREAESAASREFRVSRIAQMQHKAVQKKRGRAFRMSLESIGTCATDHDHRRPPNQKYVAQLLKEFQPDDRGGVLQLSDGRLEITLPDGFGGLPRSSIPVDDQPLPEGIVRIRGQIDAISRR